MSDETIGGQVQRGMLSNLLPRLAKMGGTELSSPMLARMLQTQAEVDLWNRLSSVPGLTVVEDLLSLRLDELIARAGIDVVERGAAFSVLCWIDRELGVEQESYRRAERLAPLEPSRLRSTEDASSERVRDRFPGLVPIARLSWADPRIMAAARSRDDGLAVARIRRQFRGGTIGDLLDEPVEQIAEWRGVGPVRFQEILDLVARLEAAEIVEKPTGGSVLRSAELRSSGGHAEMGRPTAADVMHLSLMEVFPHLDQIAELRLDSRELDRLTTGHWGALALQWVRSRSKETTIGGLGNVGVREILGWPGIGETKLQVILDFLTRVNNAVTAEIAATEVPVSGAPSNESKQDAAVGHALEALAAWFATTVGTGTWGSAFSRGAESMPPDVLEAWDVVSASDISDSAGAGAEDVLQAFFGELGPEEEAILFERVVSNDPRTLGELGERFGVTRERIRQREAKLRNRLSALAEDDQRWRSVRWAVHQMRERLGCFAPRAAYDSLLPSLSQTAKDVVTWVAGYEVAPDTCRSSDFEVPMAGDLDTMPGTSMVVDELALIERLESRGVRTEFLDQAIDQVEGMHRIDGQLVLWKGSQADKAVAVLEIRDEPQSIEDLFEAVGSTSLTSFRNRLYDDQRLMRVTKTRFGLVSWGGTRYTSVVDLMCNRLASGPMTIEDLGRELERTYEVSANSVSMYSAAPIFKTAGDVIALRGKNDAYLPRFRPGNVAGMVYVDKDRLVWNVTVDAELLRGSGRHVGQELGVFLGLLPGDDPIELESSCGSVRFTWSETSHLGPSVGSLRAFAEELEAVPGSTIRLIIDRTNGQVTLGRAPTANRGETHADELTRLTGLPLETCSDPHLFALAVGVDQTLMDDVLRRRGDDRWADLVLRIS